MNPIARLGIVLRYHVGRKTPDPFLIALFLTLLTFVAGWLWGDNEITWSQIVQTWSGDGGVWRLLAFSMQACLMLVLGSTLAEAPVFRKNLERAARYVQSPRALVALTAGLSVTLALFNWSVSLIGGALLAREGGRIAKQKGWKLHYPLLCAAGYSGLMTWHGGLSGSAPLKVTRMEDLEEVLGPSLAQKIGTIGLDETLFSSLNAIVSIGLLVLAVVIFSALTPADGTDVDAQAAPDYLELQTGPKHIEAGGWLYRPLLGYAFGGLLLWGLGLQITDVGWTNLDLNRVNLILFACSMLLHGSLGSFVDAAERAIRGCTGVILQFPLYAGIMGTMAATGLNSVISDIVISVDRWALPIVSFFSAAVVNIFVPSGGGQWAVQGPILMEAAVKAEIAPSLLVMSMAYGDQLTNMIQPFWALPLLSVTGVRASDIAGYALTWMVCGGMWIAGILFWTGFSGLI